MSASTYPCWGPGCNEIVQARRISVSGTHWCRKSACQNAKQRYFRAARRAASQPDKASEQDQFIADLAHRDRVTCHGCGLEGALPGWAHRAPDGVQTCFAIGRQGRLLPRHWFDILHPERAPQIGATS